MGTTPRPLKPGGRRALAYRVVCPLCAVVTGASCRSLGANRRVEPHESRVQEAKVLGIPKGVRASIVQVVETPAEPRVALPAGTDVEAQVHAVLRTLAGEPTDTVTLVKARNLLHTAGIEATLEWAGLQFRVTLPDGREFLAPAADTLAKAFGVTGRWA